MGSGCVHGHQVDIRQTRFPGRASGTYVAVTTADCDNSSSTVNKIPEHDYSWQDEVFQCINNG